MGDSDEKIYLRAWREYRGLTQEQLAEKIDSSSGYLSQIERMTRPGTRKWLRRAAAALSVRVDQLYSPPPSMADRDRFYDDDAAQDEAAPPLDAKLMRECVRMSMQILAGRLKSDGDVAAAADAAADAAVESYFTYFRLKNDVRGAA